MFQKLISGFGIVLLVILGEYVVRAKVVNVTQYPGELCNRKCVEGESQVCYFHWFVENYHAMGPACGKCQEGVLDDCLKTQCIIGDGFQKGVNSINRMIPGPPILACKDDTIVVDVQNMAHGSAITFHWHGIRMMDTPYFDGVPYVTQCPIPFDSTFRYAFKATQPGTHFFHSHSGFYKLNGLYGALIIRQPEKDIKEINEYDYDEHTMLISDWRHDVSGNSFPGLPKGVSFPDSFLINGKGTNIDEKTFERSVVPVTKFQVKPGFRYRFRLIFVGSLTCAVSVQIEQHRFKVIASDGFPVKTIGLDTIVINSGERYDIVVNANKTEGDYWIRVRGLESCQTRPTDTVALLSYITKPSDINRKQPSFPDYKDPYPTGSRLNHPQANCFDDDNEYCTADLTALQKDTNLITSEPDHKFTISFHNEVLPPERVFVPNTYVRFDNPEQDVVAAGVINNVSHIFPPQPILTQYSDVDPAMFCEKSGCPEKCNGEIYRDCIHIVKIKTNSVVQMTIHDAAVVPGLDHPFHLHGHTFAVMGLTQNSTDMAEAIEYAGRYRKDAPVWKDTISVPMNGVVVTRFLADNPGAWLIHCHYELHMATGMALLLLVGEPSEWVKPPVNFPKCGNYIPDITTNDPPKTFSLNMRF